MTAREHSIERLAALQALFERVEAAPHTFDFFALLRSIEGLLPEAPRFGRALRPVQEPLRLGQEPELSFPPVALASLTRGGAVPRLGVHFFGLLGPQGPMPLHLTEYVRERVRQRADPTLQCFLDVFHHRLLSLFYRAWAQSQPCVQHDRPDDDRFAVWMGASIGLDARVRPRDGLTQDARLFHAGLLGSRTRPPEGLVKILSSYFRVKVRVEQHVPQWLPLDTAERTRLGYARNRSERIGAVPAEVGNNVVAGTKVWDRQFKFRVVLGPLTLAQYERFLPGGSGWRLLVDWVREYAGLHLLWDVQLAIRGEEIPASRLERRVRLGVTAWIGRCEARARADLRVRPQSSFIVLRADGGADGCSAVSDEAVIAEAR
ncbi:MAG TPA: type VI secretion system baseplate subunit TssG [Burkholderiaceae bacterium]|nr:type VI secretion system baseplate subunit TssG [Burkholderiaceae bacterium]